MRYKSRVDESNGMAAEREARRRRVLEAIAPGVLLIASTPVALRNNDVEHDFRQDSDLYYLTGFDEPESVLVLHSERDERYGLFVRPRDPEREAWDGRRAGVEGARARFGAQEAHPIGELAERLPDLLGGVERLYYRLGLNRAFDDVVLRALDKARARGRRGATWPTQIIDPATVVHEMRLFKSSSELDRMRKAAAITAEAHVAAMAACRPGMFEYEIEALLFSTVRRLGASRLAYSSIVGSGPNATVLHYRDNDRRMLDGELLLIDAGCEYGYYASDVTRTFPVNGRFSPAQRAIYEIVVDAQLQAIDATRPGATLDTIHKAAFERVTDGLIELGLIEGPHEQALEEERAKKFFMHKTSHFLGMDVHDVGRAHLDGKPRPLEPQMVITVEPGIYVGDDAEVSEEFRGIGVRIEDDVLVTPDGAEVLTSAVPKRIDDVERACRG